MDPVKLLIILVIITTECNANNISVIEKRVGSCTFDHNDTCGYNIQSPWEIHEGSFLFMGRISLLHGGQDDDFYAFFEPQHSDRNPLFSMASPLLPGGAACLSFYYTLPATIATLHVRTRTEDNVSAELWNVTGNRIKDWARVEGLVVEQNEAYMIEFVARTASNAFVGVDNITVESFKCDPGYSPVKSEMLAYCASAINTLPSCEQHDCEPFYNFNHGNVDILNTTYGSIATITCHLGYKLNGSSTVECGSNGEWNHTGLNCVPVDCGPLPPPSHGKVSSSATIYGSTATITCHAGHILHGSSTSTCNSNGTWSNNVETCTPVDCGPFPRPMKSYLSTGPTTYNSTVTITCFPGYTVSGNDTSKCGENGNWRYADQECVLQTVFLKVPEASCTFADNDTCNCDISKPSLPLEGNITFNMLNEMNNSFSPSGQGASCYLVAPDNASVQSFTSFTMTSPTLQPGLYLISLEHIFSFGELHVTVETDANETKNVTYIERDQRLVNEIVILTEERNFRVVFRANDTKGGHLGIDDIHILKACVLLNLTNGHITVDRNTAYFRCNEGYRLVGNSSATCTQWAWNFDKPSCELIDCGTPIAPSNGHVTSTSTSYDSYSTVSCNYGYLMKGIYMGLCDTNGKWSNENTTCLSIDSTMSSALSHGCSHYSWNITVNLTLLRRLFPNYKTELQIFLGSIPCKGEERNGFIFYDNDFNECLTQRKVSANLVTFENQLVLVFNPQNSLSSKEFNWTENVHCNVVDKGAVSSISTNSLQSDVNSISISVYSDPFFQTRLPSNPLHVHIGDTVYVKVSSPNLHQEIKLQLKSCFVRPTLDTDSRLDILLIQNGCEVESGTHMISVEAHEIKFLFQNYDYVSHREGMNVFCNVAYCNSQDLSVDCTQTCTGMLGLDIVG